MTALAGVAGTRPLVSLERACRDSIQAQSLYGREVPRFAAVPGACLGVSLFDRTPQGAHDRQPLVDERFVLVADARIDNREELTAALGLAGAATSDSDIVLAGWKRWSTGLLDRLAGSFALAVYDRREKRLVLARSPESDRPLCYRVEGDMLRFASMPSGLFDASPAFNLPGIARYLICGDTAQVETFFAGIAAVPPGHILEWSPGAQTLRRWWCPAGSDESPRPNAVEEFRDLLEKSVRSRLRRVSGPIAAQLSGGFDSSAVAATAAPLLDRPTDLIAYTMVPAPGVPHSNPRNYVVDEGPLASETARLLGIRHELVSHSAPMFDCLAGHARLYQEPNHNVINFGWGDVISRKAAAEGAEVILVGEKGNASVSFGGIDSLSSWLRRGRLLEYWKQVHAAVRSGAARWRGALLYSSIDFLPTWLGNLAAGYAHQTPSNVFMRAEWLDRSRQLTIGSNYKAEGLREGQFEMYANNDLGLIKKASLAQHGMDERDPTADRRLIEFSLALPAEEFLKDGVTRRLARRALADRLPAAVIDNKLRGYQGADWHGKFDPRQALEWLEEIRSSATAAEVIDLAALERAIAASDDAAKLPPLALRDWGSRLSRAISVGAFIREVERDCKMIGRRS